MLNWGVKRQAVGLIAVSSLLAVALVGLLWGSEREPRCRAKTLSAWLLEGAWKPLGLTADQEEAIRCMGTNSLPFCGKRTDTRALLGGCG